MRRCSGHERREPRWSREVRGRSRALTRAGAGQRPSARGRRTRRSEQRAAPRLGRRHGRTRGRPCASVARRRASRSARAWPRRAARGRRRRAGARRRRRLAAGAAEERAQALARVRDRFETASSDLVAECSSSQRASTAGEQLVARAEVPVEAPARHAERARQRHDRDRLDAAALQRVQARGDPVLAVEALRSAHAATIQPLYGDGVPYIPVWNRSRTDLHLLPSRPAHAFNVYLMGDVLVDAGDAPRAPAHPARARGARPRGARAHPRPRRPPGRERGALRRARHRALVPGDADADAMESGDLARPRPGRTSSPARSCAGGPGPAHPVARRLREGDEVGGFTVLETPGHSPGHVAFWREADRTLVAGDVLFGRHRVTGRPGLHEPPRHVHARPGAQPRVDPAPRRARARRRLLRPRPAAGATRRALRAFAAALPAADGSNPGRGARPRDRRSRAAARRHRARRARRRCTAGRSRLLRFARATRDAEPASTRGCCCAGPGCSCAGAGACRPTASASSARA